MDSIKTEIPEEEIKEEIKRFGPIARDILLEQLELLQKASKEAKSATELATLSQAMERLISSFRSDWFYFAFPAGKNRVLTSKGIIGRTE